MANKLEILIQAKDEASKELGEVSKSLDGMSNQLKIVGVAMIAVGAAALKMIADARKLNAELAQVAITTGIATNELRDLALSLSNVTFRLNSVIATIVLLSRAGVKNEADLKAHANAFDALADAIGSVAEEVAFQLIPAFGIFGLQLPKTMEDTDKLTWLVKNTLLSMSDFASVMQYVAMYGAELNVTLDDMIAIMFELNERNITGAAATRLFRTAVTQAAREGESLNDVLNINQDTMDDWIAKISIDAVGATEAFSNAANTQYGIMGKLGSAWEDFVLVAGSALTPLEPIFALMTALGPMMLFFATSIGQAALATGAHTIALIAHGVALVATKIALAAATAAQWALNVAMSANPIGLIILAIAGLITGVILLVKNWDKVKVALGKVWDWMKDAFGKVGDFFKKVWDGITNAFKSAANFIAGIINGLIGGFESFLNFFVGGINFLISGLNTIIGAVNQLLPGAIEIPIVPTIGEVKLGRIPLLDTGGLIQGPGVFAVGEGVTEIAREPSSGEIHIHVGYLLGDELSLNKFARIVKQKIQQDDRRTSYGPVNQGYYHGVSSI